MSPSCSASPGSVILEVLSKAVEFQWNKLPTQSHILSFDDAEGTKARFSVASDISCE